MRQHYPSLLTHVTIKLIPCPSICTDALGILSSLSPYSFDTSPSAADIPNVADVPIGAIPLLAVASPEFQDTVNKTIIAANIVYHEFVKSEEGHGFSGQIIMLGDSMGSLLAYEALCRPSNSNDIGGIRSSRNADDDERFDDSDMDAKKLLVAPSPRRRRSSSSNDTRGAKLDFEVNDFFMFGSPLSIVLAAKKLHDSKAGVIASNQEYEKL